MPQTLLASQVPDLHPQVVVMDFFNVAADRRLSHNNFIECKLVEDCCLASIVEADNNDLELLVSVLASQSLEQCGQVKTHFSQSI